MAAGRVDAERRQRRRARKPCLRGGIGVKQRAVRREHRDGFVGIGEQPAHALGERQRGARRLGRGDQNRGYAVGKHDARADTGQRAAEAGAEAAQPLEPLLRTGRQRRGQPDDLRGGCVAGR